MLEFTESTKNIKYVIPLDELDLSYLNLPTTRSKIVKPLWSCKPEKTYQEYEFIIASDSLGDDKNSITNEIDEKHSEMKTKTEDFDMKLYLRLVRAVLEPHPNVFEELDNQRIKITTVQGNTVKVPSDHFLGLSEVRGHIQCRVCREMVTDREAHLMTIKHLKMLATPVMDENCVRQLDELWSYCVICNDIIGDTSFHVQYNIEHQDLVKQAMQHDRTTNNTEGTNNTGDYQTIDEKIPSGSLHKTNINKPSGSINKNFIIPSGSIDKTVTKSPGSIDKTVTKPSGSIDKTVTKSSGSIDKTVTKSPGSIDKTVIKPSGSIDKTVTKSSGSIDKTVTKPSGSIDKTVTKPSGSIDKTVTKSSGSIDKTVTKPSGSIDKTVTKSSGSIDKYVTKPSGSIDKTVTKSSGSIDKTVTKPSGSIDKTVTKSSGSIDKYVTKSSGSIDKTNKNKPPDSIHNNDGNTKTKNYSNNWTNVLESCTDKETVYCKVCDTFVRNKNYNITTHVAGTRHNSNVYVYNKSKCNTDKIQSNTEPILSALKNKTNYYCEICKLDMHVNDKKYHIKGNQHINSLKSQELKIKFYDYDGTINQKTIQIVNTNKIAMTKSDLDIKLESRLKDSGNNQTNILREGPRDNQANIFREDPTDNQTNMFVEGGSNNQTNILREGPRDNQANIFREDPTDNQTNMFVEGGSNNQTNILREGPRDNQANIFREDPTDNQTNMFVEGGSNNQNVPANISTAISATNSDVKPKNRTRNSNTFSCIECNMKMASHLKECHMNSLIHKQSLLLKNLVKVGSDSNHSNIVKEIPRDNQTNILVEEPSDNQINISREGPTDNQNKISSNGPGDNPKNTLREGSRDNQTNTPREGSIDDQKKISSDGPGDNPKNTLREGSRDNQTNTSREGSIDDQTNIFLSPNMLLPSDIHRNIIKQKPIETKTRWFQNMIDPSDNPSISSTTSSNAFLTKNIPKNSEHDVIPFKNSSLCINNSSDNRNSIMVHRYTHPNVYSCYECKINLPRDDYIINIHLKSYAHFCKIQAMANRFKLQSDPDFLCNNDSYNYYLDNFLEYEIVDWERYLKQFKDSNNACKVCRVIFSNEEHFNNHFGDNHSRNFALYIINNGLDYLSIRGFIHYYYCKRCSVKISKYELMKHMDTYHSNTVSNSNQTNSCIII